MVSQKVKTGDTTMKKMKEIKGFTKIQVKSFMQMKLKTDIDWAQKAVVKVFESQTPQEQRNHFPRGEDEKGFSVYDAPLLSNIACKIKRRASLTKREIQALKDIMPRYAVQMVNLSEEAILVKQLKKYYLV
jgi:predicted nucleic acid-binding protein